MLIHLVEVVITHPVRLARVPITRPTTTI
jgi:hypothetical protein